MGSICYQIRFQKNLPSLEEITAQFYLNTGLEIICSGTWVRCDVFQRGYLLIFDTENQFIKIKLGYTRMTYFLSALIFVLIDLGGVYCINQVLPDLSRKKFKEVVGQSDLSLRKYLDLKDWRKYLSVQ